MIRLATLFLSTFLLIPYFGAAQSLSISGQVVDSKDHQPLTGVVVRLNPVGDTLNLQTTLSDVDGLFNFDNLSSGTYQIRSSYIGYQVLNKTISLKKDNLVLDTFRLQSTASNLQGVTVTAEQIRAQ